MSLGILFLCTGNACRSQMAEGLARALLPPDVTIYSAGTDPKGLDARSVVAMAELGVDISTQASKHVDQIPLGDVTHVITLCDSAAQSCPTVAAAKVEHWDLPDPAAAAGNSDDVRAAFRAVRDDILSRMTTLSMQYLPEPAVGVIGGSGFYDLPGVEDLREVRVATPFGEPSDVLFVGRMAGRKLVFLPRHGRGHKLLPTEVNARANIYAMKRIGVSHIVSVSAVGSLREEIVPGGHVVLPRQFIDRALRRQATFFGQGIVAHVSVADPVCNSLADRLGRSARAETEHVHESGTYLCMEGPQFSTRAESHLYRQWGADIIGMTNATEAKCAREAEICYAVLAFPTDYDCWRTSSEEVSIDEVLAVLKANVAMGQRILGRVLGEIDPKADCRCRHALDTALITPLASFDAQAQVRLHALVRHRLEAQKELS